MTALSFSFGELTGEISLGEVLVERFVSLWRKKKDERLKAGVHICSIYVVQDYCEKNAQLLLNFAILVDSCNLLNKSILLFLYWYMNFHAYLQTLSGSVSRNLRFGTSENDPNFFSVAFQGRQ